MRRHLNLSWTEWKQLPWYEQQALREGLARELYNITPASDVTAMSEFVDAGITFD